MFDLVSRGLFVVCCVLCDYCVLVVVCVVRRSACCLLKVVHCWSLFVDWLFGIRCFLSVFVLCCLLFVVVSWFVG